MNGGQKNELHSDNNNSNRLLDNSDDLLDWKKEVMEMGNPFEMFLTNEDGKRVITIEGLQKLSEYEPYFVIPKEAKPKIVETASGDYDVAYDKNYPILVEWRKKQGD